VNFEDLFEVVMVNRRDPASRYWSRAIIDARVDDVGGYREK
jgi:hypothetical protein